MRRKSLSAALVVAAFVLAPAAVSAKDNWVTFTDPTHTFSLNVPEAPTVMDKSTEGKNGKTVPLIEYMIDRGSYALLTMVSDYAGMTIDREHAVDNAVSGMEGDDRKILTNEIVTVDGHMGREVTLVDASGEKFLDRAFFFGDRLYQTITVVPKDATSEQVKVATRYAYSMHFLK